MEGRGDDQEVGFVTALECDSGVRRRRHRGKLGTVRESRSVVGL
jgi:hypothetical protein